MTILTNPEVLRVLRVQHGLMEEFLDPQKRAARDADPALELEWFRRAANARVMLGHFLDQEELRQAMAEAGGAAAAAFAPWRTQADGF